MNGSVAINELITGVNIALGSGPLSSCPSFDVNGDEMVEINELISAVNNALTGCPTDTPTPTATAGTAETPTPAPRIDFVCQGVGRCVAADMSTDRSCLSEGDCNIGAGESCGAVGTCTGGTNRGADCAADGDCGQGASCTRKSRLDLESSLATLPLGLVGSLAFHCGEPGSDGNRPCTCEIQRFAPIQIPGIGFVCISPGDSACEPGFLDCDGGSAADVTVVADGNIGACTDNTDCASQCDDYCSGNGTQAIQSGCTGYCAGGDRDNMACDCDSIPPTPPPGCPAGGMDCPGGQCNGPDPVTAGTCQCQCVDTTSGEPGGPGTIRCNLPTDIVIENQSPCGDGDVAINIGSPCIPLTSGTTSTVILNANGRKTAFPSHCAGGGRACSSSSVCPDGTCEATPTVLTGSPEECLGLMTGTATSLQLRGAVNFFGSVLGDLIIAQFNNCQ